MPGAGQLSVYSLFFFMPNLSDNAMTVLRKRGYINSAETSDDMFRRSAQLIASSDKNYGATKAQIKKTAEAFYQMQANLEYLSGSVLLNSARRHQQFSACYVLPLTDSLEDIYNQLRNAALILRTGGGIGIPLTNLRPRGSRVNTTGGISSGAVSFLRLFNYSAATISEAATRRPAMMGVLDIHHPDIIEFIQAKEDPSTLYHFNISVGITNDFMKKIKLGRGKIHLYHPNDGLTERDVDVMELWNLICQQAWKVGDPGLVFLDQMNKNCPIPFLGKYETTNPCGEQPLLPYESCNLGNINLGKFVTDKKIDWKRLAEIIQLGVHFQDNVIDLCEYPIPELSKMAKTTRKIGVGVMGWADMLIKLDLRYDSDPAIKLAGKVSKFIQTIARSASAELGHQRGSFPAFFQSVWKKKGFKSMRNSTVNTVAPTGTISIIAGCSSGIEPLFGLVYRRENLLDRGKTSLLEINQDFEKAIARGSLNKVKKILNQVSKTGSCQNIREVPQKIRDIFRTSMEIPYDWHIKMQAAWQKYTDSAVSKTINLSHGATVTDIKKAYLLSWELGCKGVTVYRDGCRDKQVLNIGTVSAIKNSQDVCPECRGEMEFADGCSLCRECGYSKCLI